MFILKEYQQKAVDQLIEFTCDALQGTDYRSQILLKAPTGAGKTVTMASYLSQLMQELHLRPGLPRDIAVIWLAPNTLHLQSYKALKGFYSELNDLRTLQISDLQSRNGLQPKDLLFVNWSSVDKEKNTFRQQGESDQNLETLIEQTRLRDTEIIVVIDEAHLSAFTGEQARKVLLLINAKIEIAVTATPNRKPDMSVVIPRQKVVAAEMIKKGIQLNVGLSVEEQQGEMLDLHLLRKAMQKRDEMAEAYKAIGVDLNPLLLIQLPSEKVTLSEDDRNKRLIMENYLAGEHNITTQNGTLAVWLSDEKDKINLDGLEDSNGLQKVLIFKQAISQGWDCPRASVIIIFRELGNPSFGIQTVGRILRMPEQKHYENELLNIGYVYTNIQNKVIQVVKDDLDYFSLQYAYRKKNIPLPHLAASFVVNDRQTPGYLLSDFERIFYKQVERKYSIEQIPDSNLFTTPDNEIKIAEATARNRAILEQHLWELDVENIEIVIPTNLNIDAYEETAILIDNDKMGHFSKTQAELGEMLDRYCYNSITRLNKSKSWKVLKRTILQFVEYYLAFDEFKARKILLHPHNQMFLNELIVLAMENYDLWLRQKGNVNRRVEEVSWTIPEERAYSESYHSVDGVDHSAMEPFFEFSGASTPEKEFVKVLETSKKDISWWYKNGDSGRNHFAISYINSYSEPRQFYVDFVIHFKNGTIGLFDTKTKRSDADAPAKHNALLDYFEKQAEVNPSQKLVGGVIVAEPEKSGMTFRYCKNRIVDTQDLKGWDFFNSNEI
jgi:type III restriction enzyme